MHRVSAVLSEEIKLLMTEARSRSHSRFCRCKTQISSVHAAMTTWSGDFPAERMWLNLPVMSRTFTSSPLSWLLTSNRVLFPSSRPHWFRCTNDAQLMSPLRFLAFNQWGLPPWQHLPAAPVTVRHEHGKRIRPRRRSRCLERHRLLSEAPFGFLSADSVWFSWGWRERLSDVQPRSGPDNEATLTDTKDPLGLWGGLTLQLRPLQCAEVGFNVAFLNY